MEYLSQECYDRLTQELNELVSVELPKARNELEEARAKGDLSENFEYHAAKRAHGRLLSRISYMQKTLRFARVMDTSRLDNDTVGLLRPGGDHQPGDQHHHGLHHRQSSRGQRQGGKDLHQVAHRRSPPRQKSRRRGHSPRALRRPTTQNRENNGVASP